MPNVTDDIRDLSADLTELGTLEMEASVDLAAQATKFDEAWAGFEKTPDKALKSLGELSGKLRLEADEKDNDRARDAARNFDSDIQELTRVRQELAAARGRRDQANIARLESQYASSQNRARGTYEMWRRGDVEQYKLKQEERKKKQQRAADDIQRAIDGLDADIGAEGNEAFGQLRTALVNLKRSLTSGEPLKNIKLPGASNFDPKKGRFDQYIESWKRRNRIDETNLRKPAEKPERQAKAETEKTETKKSPPRKTQLKTTATKEKEEKLDAEQAIHQARRRAVLDYGIAAGLIKATGKETEKELGQLSQRFEKELEEKRAERTKKHPAAVWTADDIKRHIADASEDERYHNLQRFVGGQHKLSQDAVDFLQEQRANIRPEATLRVQTLGETDTTVHQQIDRAIQGSQQLWKEFPAPQGKDTANTDIVFSGKIGRRLEKNLAEFEGVKEQILTLEGQITAERVPDEQVIEQLNIRIEQAITLKQRLMGDLDIQVEMTATREPAAMPGVTAFAVATLAGASAFVAQSAAAQANRSTAAGMSVPIAIRQASQLQPADIEGFAKLASHAANTNLGRTSSRTTTRTTAQTTQENYTQLEQLSQLIGQTPLSPEAGMALGQTLQDINPVSPSDQDIATDLRNRLPETPAIEAPSFAPAPPNAPEEPFGFESPQQAAREANLAHVPTPSMPREAGLRGALPKQPIGTSPRPMDFRAALSLQAGQQASNVAGDEQLRQLLADSGVDDDSILQDTDLEPVLRLYGRSYADQQVPNVAPPIAGAEGETGGGFLPSDVEQAQRARDLQSQQQSARQRFTGERGNSFIGFSGDALRAIEKEAGLGGIRGQIGEALSAAVAFDRNTPSEDGPANPEQEANNLLSQQMAETRNKAVTQAREKLQKQVKQQIQKLAKKAAQKSAATATRVTVETAQAVAGPEDAGITWVTLIIEMNIQLILKYVLKGFGFIGKQAISTDREGGIEADIMNEFNDFADSIQTFWEDVLTIWMDCCLQIASCIQMCGPFLLVIFMMIFVFGSAALSIIGLADKLGL